jgi:outer membrane protein assembly factor BamB
MNGEIIEEIEFNADIHGISFWKDTLVFASSPGIFAIDFSSGKASNITKIFTAEEAGLFTIPVIDKDNVYFGDTAGFIYSVNLVTKKVNWKIKCNNEAFYGSDMSPSIHDGIIYVSNIYSILYIDENTGKILVSIDMKEHLIINSPVVSRNEAYFSSDDGMLYAFDKKTGKELWNIKLAKRCMASPIISNGVIYIAACDSMDSKGYVFAIY